jgi:hypothetical protein
MSDIVIKIPKKLLQIIVGSFLIFVSLIFIVVTVAEYSSFQNPLDLLMIGALTGALGIICILWKS